MIPSNDGNRGQAPRRQDPALWLAALLALLCIVLEYGGMEPMLRFDRDAVNAGAYWQLLTANLVHLGPSHLWMNLAGLALVVALVWGNFTWLEWLLVLIVSSLAVSIGLWLFNPQLNAYVGLSGTLHGLILAGCLADLRRYPVSAGLLLAGVVAKLAWEQFSGPLPGSEHVAGGNVAVDSHLYGAIGGAVVGGLLLSRKRSGNTETT
ncbi:MAG: rhombosortase [Gammaproteobacteria bacterium]|nr:MAG: rhombosortase [Gammaproteobacteria bacterium]